MCPSKEKFNAYQLRPNYFMGQSSDSLVDSEDYASAEVSTHTKSKQDQNGLYCKQLSEEQNQDLTGLWNEAEQALNPMGNDPSPHVPGAETSASQTQQPVDIESSCELDEAQMIEWLHNCDSVSAVNTVNAVRTDGKQPKLRKDDSLSCEIDEDDLEGYWDIIEGDKDNSLQQINTKMNTWNQHTLQSSQTVSYDLMPVDKEQIQPCQSNQSMYNQSQDQRDKTNSFQLFINSAKADNRACQPIYQQYGECKLMYIDELHNGSTSAPMCEVINDGIKQEMQDDQELATQGSQLLVFGYHYLVSDLKKFATTAFRERTHSYFGAQCRNIISQDNWQQQHEYLYFSLTGESLIQTEHVAVQSKNSSQRIGSSQRIDEQILFYLSANKQKIAVADRIVSKKDKGRKEILELRAFDEFEGEAGEYIAIIESRIAKFGDFCFCSTVISTPTRKTVSRKINQTDWDQLKIKLELSNGVIIADLGVSYAISSVTNCLLSSSVDSKGFMMGMIQQDLNELNYVVRIHGISPLVGLAATISRKMFAYQT